MHDPNKQQSIMRWENEGGRVLPRPPAAKDPPPAAEPGGRTRERVRLKRGSVLTGAITHSAGELGGVPPALV